MIPIGKSTVRTELEVIPASVKIIEYVQFVYKCSECGSSDRSPDVIVKAPVPASVMKRTLALASTVAEVIQQKYMNGIPLYRFEGYEATDIVIFEHTRTQAGKHAQQFINGFSGNLVTDAYAGYEKVRNVTRCLC